MRAPRSIRPAFGGPWFPHHRGEAPKQCTGSLAAAWILLSTLSVGWICPREVRGQPPPGFTIAFIADQGLGADAEAVLALIQSEGAHAVVHSGDFDYDDDPAAWDQQIDQVLGSSFPYFASMGNHDDSVFYGPGGYQERMEARLNRIGIPWSGDLGVQSQLAYQGIHIVLVAPDLMASGHDVYIRDAFAASGYMWRVSSFHKNMRLMQPEAKGDETGWEVYEESRRAGAIIATGHAHAYSRTHLLSSMSQQTIRTATNDLLLTSDDSSTLEDEGGSFAFVSGLGGHGSRAQEVSGNWFASIYTETQNAEYGALFGVFNLYGNPALAHFYFKTITGEIIDDFWVMTQVDPVTDTMGPEARNDPLLLQAWVDATGRIRVRYFLDVPEPASLHVFDVRGRVVRVAFQDVPHGAGTHRWDWPGADPRSGVYFVQLRTPSGTGAARLVWVR